MATINFELLMSYAKKPKIFTPSTAPFWDDEHISKGMLEAHLNPDWDAASRKHDFIDKSVEWIVNSSLSEKGEKVLDLGCGPGLYAERFSKLGYNVTGIDFSKRSINYAKAQAIKNGLGILYYYQNYLTIDFENEFDLAIMIYCDFGVLSVEQRDLFLKKVYKSLKRGGRFIFDVFTPKQFADAKEENRTWEFNEKGGFWRANSHICLNSHYIYLEHETHLRQVIVLDETESIQVYNIWERTYTKESIIELLSLYGFKTIEVFSDVKGSKYVESSKTLGIVVEK